MRNIKEERKYYANIKYKVTISVYLKYSSIPLPSIFYRYFGIVGNIS